LIFLAYFHQVIDLENVTKCSNSSIKNLWL